jgi:hypothetical protein
MDGFALSQVAGKPQVFPMWQMFLYTCHLSIHWILTALQAPGKVLSFFRIQTEGSEKLRDLSRATGPGSSKIELCLVPELLD